MWVSRFLPSCPFPLCAGRGRTGQQTEPRWAREQWAGPPSQCEPGDWPVALSTTESRPRVTSHDAAHHGGGSAAARARRAAGPLLRPLLRGGDGGCGADGRTDGREGCSFCGRSVEEEAGLRGSRRDVR